MKTAAGFPPRIKMLGQEHDSGRPAAVGENVSGFNPSFNGSVRVELSESRTSSEGGAIALREALDASGVV